jgi:DNA-directed RNA polymerase subunit RPC12/RpoP
MKSTKIEVLCENCGEIYWVEEIIVTDEELKCPTCGALNLVK